MSYTYREKVMKNKTGSETSHRVVLDKEEVHIREKSVFTLVSFTYRKSLRRIKQDQKQGINVIV